MGDLVVHGVDDRVIDRLRDRASRENASLDAVVAEILRDAVGLLSGPRMTTEEAIAEMDRIRASTKRSNVSSVDLIRAWRDGE